MQYQRLLNIKWRIDFCKYQPARRDPSWAIKVNVDEITWGKVENISGISIPYPQEQKGNHYWLMANSVDEVKLWKGWQKMTTLRSSEVGDKELNNMRRSEEGDTDLKMAEKDAFPQKPTPNVPQSWKSFMFATRILPKNLKLLIFLHMVSGRP